MCFAGRTDTTYIYDEIRPAAGGGLQLRLTSGPREITHVVAENAIFVEDFRYLGDPGGGGPVDGSRAFLRIGVSEIYG